MRRGLFGITIGSAFFATLLANGAWVLAAEPPPQKGITSVTDGAGNPVPLEEAAAPGRPQGLNSPGATGTPDVQRGQAWWPYPSALPPYTGVDESAESLTEDEILVNGVAKLNARNPQAALRQMPADLLIETGGQLSQEEGFYLVKIQGFTRNQQQVDALGAAGAVLGEFININTYIAKIPFDAYAAVKALPFVTFIGDYHPAYKISPRIGLEPIPAEEAFDTVTGEMKPWVFELTLHKGANLEEVLGALGVLGIFPGLEEIVSNEAMTVLFVKTSPENLPSLAKIPGVKWIAEKAYARLTASNASPATIPMVLQNNGAFTTNTGIGWKLWNAGVDGNASGTAQIVTLMDTGLNTNMEHFSQDTAGVGTVGASHRKVVGYDIYGGDQCVTNFSAADGGHGTWTSQHAVGSISNMTANPDTTHTPNNFWDPGIARDAKVYFQDMGLSTGSIAPPGDLGPSITAAIGKGSFIQNHSWSAQTPTYDTNASNADTAMFTNPNMILTASAGNRGTAGTSTIGSPCTAKNIICVGGTDVASPSALFQDCNWDGSAACGGANDLGSSRGPVTTSNRVKPDICTYMGSSGTVGGEIMAGDRPHAMCQTDATKTVYWDWTNNSFSGGTSFAAPQVAGLAALVRDYFLAGFYPTGTATPANALTPVGALVKAVILASGEDMATTASPSSSITITKRHSNDVGYGRANLPSVLHIGSGAPFLWVQNNDTLGDGATKTFFYNINGNGVPLRVMMAYYDSAGNALQKDCDLKVTIGANVYWGNRLSAGWSTTSLTTRDHTNPTEGVFLDAAHGLPASGTVRVDVIGFSNPGGMNYSLVVAGDVASQSVTQVSLDKGTYTCSETVQVTVNDAAGSSPVSVTLTSKNSGGTPIDTETVSCTGSNGVFTGTIETGSGITVVDGGSITATYSTASPAIAAISCQATLADGGFSIEGGCDNAAAGTDEVAGPLSNGGINEFYNKYMDAGEYSSYTVRFVNQTGVALTDAYVSLSFSGAGASKMTVFNNPVHVGAVPPDTLAGAVFQVSTDPSALGLTSVNMDFDITSPADGYTAASRLTQVQLLQANDTISRQAQCSPFNTALTPWFESAVAGRPTNPWRWSGSAAAPATVSSEVRTDGACGSATANAAAMVGQSGTAANFAASADSFLLQRFQPALQGNGPSGQPYHYIWKWHSFYHASETLNNQGGAWGVFYNDQWNSATNPTGDQATGFPISLAYFYHTVFDYVGTWNWETANTGTPDDPRLDPASGGAPNQLFITFNGITGLATSGTHFAYGHEHLDDSYFGSANVNRDIALDNDRLVYDQYYAAAQAGASCGGGGQPGQVAFERYSYDDCPTSTAVLSVLDANAVSPIQVTVTSPGTGDSETVTLTGTAPYFSGTLTLATDTGRGNDNGVLFVLPSETINATYTDAAPAGSSIASALTGCTGGAIVYESNVQISDNGDNDVIADNGETITLDITVKNNTGSALTNARVAIFSDTPNVDCVFDGEALYGTVAAGATATNPSGDRFSFHVAPAVACSDWQNPPTARFTVVITGDGFDGSSTLQTFALSLDLDTTGTGGTYTYTQNFAADPGWTTNVTPSDDVSCVEPYVNNFHWCAACGNGGGGYGAWVGDSAFGTGGQNYTLFDSSTLYSPPLVANGNLTLQFSVAYRTEAGWDGALVQRKVGAGAWTTLGYTTPAQSAIPNASCSPLLDGVTAWNGNGVSWTTTNAAPVVASAGQAVQFRWRLGSDESVLGPTYGGFGVDSVVITGLKQTLICEPTRNTGLPGCGPACDVPSGLTNNTAADLDLCADTGVQVTWSQDAGSWGDGGSGTRTYDVLRNGTPIASGIAYGTTTLTDTTGVNGTTYTYSVRYNNGCGESATTTGVAAADGAPVCTALDACHVAGVCDPGTGVCSNPAASDGTGCDDGNACTSSDACSGGACVGTPVPPPGEVDDGVRLAPEGGGGTEITWNSASGATTSDVVRGSLGGLPVGPGGGDEVCLASALAGNSLIDGTDPALGEGFWYLVRGRSACGTGPYGYQGLNGAPSTPRVTTTCD